jgi:CBS domain-containing protein
MLAGQTPHGQERRSRAGTDAADATGGGAGAAGSLRRPAAGIHRDLIAIDPEDDLMTVSLKLLHHGIHHLPVFDADQNAVLAILSYKGLLLHLTAKFTDGEAVRMMEQPLRAMGVGSFGEDILVVPETASVVSVLHVLAERRISSVPIVAADGSNVLVDVYSREDVAFLANDPTLMVLDAPVGDVRRAQISMVRCRLRRLRMGGLGSFAGCTACCDVALTRRSHRPWLVCVLSSSAALSDCRLRNTMLLPPAHRARAPTSASSPAIAAAADGHRQQPAGVRRRGHTRARHHPLRSSWRAGGAHRVRRPGAPRDRHRESVRPLRLHLQGRGMARPFSARAERKLTPSMCCS